MMMSMDWQVMLIGEWVEIIRCGHMYQIGVDDALSYHFLTVTVLILYSLLFNNNKGRCSTKKKYTKKK